MKKSIRHKTSTDTKTDIMMILAAAVGQNNELGRDDGKSLWSLPDEYNRFRKSILSFPIIMGRKSFDVIEKPLEGSTNIVVTRRTDYDGKGAIVVQSLDEAIKKAGDVAKVYVIGGGELFKIAIRIADKIEISRIHGVFPEATVFFPEISEKTWKLIASDEHPKDARHQFSFAFQEWIRK